MTAARIKQLPNGRRLFVPLGLSEQILAFRPKSRLSRAIRECLLLMPDEYSDMKAELLDAIQSCAIIESRLGIVVIRQPDSQFALARPRRKGELIIEDYGIVRRKVVTTVGVNNIVDAFDNTVADVGFIYHGIGTGSTAEAVGDTALVTELTTQYQTDNTRATATESQPSANEARTVATNTVDAAVALRSKACSHLQRLVQVICLIDQCIASSTLLMVTQSRQRILAH